MSIDCIVSTIRAMRRQEKTGYVRGDYLRQAAFLSGKSESGCQNVDVSPECRTKMVQWCYTIVDYCKFKRENVSIAMSILDRFLLTRTGMEVLKEREAFQLASLTSLYVTIKTNQAEVMSSKLISRLSRDVYSVEQVESMERTILRSLNWRINPPTVVSFVFQFLQLIPANILDSRTKVVVFDIAKFQAELGIGEYRLIIVNESIVAFSAIINALESLGIDPNVLDAVGLRISEAAAMDKEVLQSYEVRRILFEAIMEHSTCASAFASMFGACQIQPSQKEFRNGAATNSPRSVMQSS